MRSCRLSVLCCVATFLLADVRAARIKRASARKTKMAIMEDAVSDSTVEQRPPEHRGGRGRHGHGHIPQLPPNVVQGLPPGPQGQRLPVEVVQGLPPGLQVAQVRGMQQGVQAMGGVNMGRPVEVVQGLPPGLQVAQVQGMPQGVQAMGGVNMGRPVPQPVQQPPAQIPGASRLGNCCKNSWTGSCWQMEGGSCGWFKQVSCSRTPNCPQRTAAKTSCPAKEVPDLARKSKASSSHKVSFCLSGVHTYLQVPTCCNMNNKWECMGKLRRPSGALDAGYTGLPDMTCHCEPGNEKYGMAEVHFNGGPMDHARAMESLYHIMPLVPGEVNGAKPGKCADRSSTSGTIDMHPVCAWGIITKLKEVYGSHCQGGPVGYCRTGGLNAEAVLKRGITGFLKGVGETFLGCTGTLDPSLVLEKKESRAICWGFTKDFYSLYCYWKTLAAQMPACSDINDPLNSWACCGALKNEQLSKVGP